MPSTGVLKAVLSRDRLVVIAGLVTVIVLSWAFILADAGMDMPASEAMSPAMAVATPAVWTPAYAALIVVMWGIMMVAMMLPSAAPMILLFATVGRKQRERGAPPVSTGLFVLAYMVVWTGFSVLATGIQWGLERAGQLSAMMTSTSLALGGGILLAAGIWQLTPLKHACLRHCRAPLSFLAQRWRAGRAGAFRMGLEHGAFCLGCCWVLMGLLFYGGVMNLYWIAGIAAFVLLEKTIPAGHRFGSAAGIVLIAWGGALLASAFLG